MTTQQASARTVANWLAGLGLGAYADEFARADIDLEALALLSDADLTELGVRSLGHRRKIMAGLSHMAAGETVDLTASELRFVTVMFCDLVGSTRLSLILGAERFAELLDGFYRAVNQAIDPFGGYIAQYHGDGVLVYFGYPKGLEDAAIRCVLSAVKVVARVAELLTPHGERVAARVGVASGVAVVNGHNGGRHLEGGRAFGATINLAARVQGEAEPGTIVLAETTASLVEDQFDLYPLGARQLKGIDDACTLFEVRGQRSPELGAAMLSRPGRARFVGRRTELVQLAEYWTRVLCGGSIAVTVIGEAGIGKTRLISEFLTPLRAQGNPVRRIVSRPGGQDIPFHAFLPALERDREDGEEAPAAIMRLLDDASGANQSERRQRRTQLIAAMVDYFAGDARTPRAIWLEDMHWADPSTIEVLSALVRCKRSGLFLIASTRAPLPFDKFGDAGQMAALELSPLDIEDAGQIILDILSDASGSAAFVPILAQRAEGVPIFAEELALEMRARLGAPGTGDSVPDAAHLMSSSLQQSLQARIGQLTIARPLMRLVASIGREVPVSLLRDLWSGRNPIELALIEIVETGLAELKLSRRDDQENHLVVRHQLIVDCAYDMILTRDRMSIHSQIADALESRVSQGFAIEPALRAGQLERADRLSEAAELWAAAGRRAALQSADAEAVSLYRRAIGLIPRCANRDSEWGERFEADTLLAMFSAIVGAYGYRAAGPDILTRIQGLSRRLGGPERVFSSLFVRWLQIATQGDIDTAHQFALGLSGIADADNTGLQRLMLHRMIGSTSMFRGEFVDAKVHLAAFLDAYQPDQHARQLRQFGVTDNFVTVLCCQAAIEGISGTHDSTVGAIERAVGAAEASGHAHTLCHTLTFGASLPAAIRGDWEMASRYTHRLKQLTNDRGLVFWMLFDGMLGGILEVAQGDHRSGQAAFRQAQEALEAQGFRFMGPTFKLVMALAARDSGASLDLDLVELQHELLAGERWLVPACQALIGSPSKA
ncbi:ATP-binding protein [Sinorhizobium americanum]|uniref:Adenylate cyclase n=1 Tax=Sinorhizobium americanum TaxID=194963 RepID=A0A1L3LZ82_9HYPH|nr:AAA family ATPase [Sinorhizobium americanum]APG95417.1 adenylate cyclase [Sinorhizobium americanum]OAP39200.1 hypothetical protein ATC00_07020 [Sinorhizobium americanum]